MMPPPPRLNRTVHMWVPALLKTVLNSPSSGKNAMAHVRAATGCTLHGM
jgi:hypothetical protein